MWLTNFRRVYSNSKGVFYLPWQNKFSNLKTTCHIKPKFFLWTKLLENLLLTKYFISVAGALRVTQPFLCFWVNRVNKSAQYIYQFTGLDFHTIPCGFRCLPDGKFVPRSQPGKFLKIWHFLRWAQQSQPGYWNSEYVKRFVSVYSSQVYMNFATERVGSVE